MMRSSRLRIGIDAHAIGEHQTGNERWMVNVIRRLREACDHHLVLFFTNAEEAERWSHLPETTVHALRPRHPTIRVPFVLPFLSAKEHLDVLLVQYVGPPLATCPLVTVVHDVSFSLYPDSFSLLERLWMPRLIPGTMRRARFVVTGSRFSAKEITRLYGISADKVMVAHYGIDPSFLSAAEQSDLPDDLPAAVTDGPFFLAVGNLQPRKNLMTLVRAYRQLVEEHPEVPERLVFAGQDWFRTEALRAEAHELVRSGRIRFLGYVSDETLIFLLRRATALAFPSVYEGFGLPVIEAMGVGTPTAVSDIPVMREVAGDASLFVDPKEPSSWAEALLRLSENPRLRQRLKARGRERARVFGWDLCARVVLEALERVAREPVGRRADRSR